MKMAGWIFMLLSWGVILGLFVYSMVRTLRPRKPEDGSRED